MVARRALVSIGGKNKQLPSGDSILGGETTDGLIEGASNLYFTAARVRSLLLTGLDVTVSTAVLATDSLLAGVGKLQAQISKLIALAPLPTDTTKTYTFTPGTGWVASSSGGSSHPVMYVVDERASGVAADSLTNNAQTSRTLNTARINNISGATVASNTIILPPGGYRISAWVPANDVTKSKSRLYNITASAVLAVGTSEAVLTGTGNGTAWSAIFHEVTFGVTTSIRLDTYVNGSSSKGGIPTSNGDVETYSRIIIEKIS